VRTDNKPDIIIRDNKQKTCMITNIGITGDRNVVKKEAEKILKCRVFHKSVKHFKNSQQINYSTDHGSSYADRERNSPSFFYIFHKFSICPPLVIRQTIMR